MEDTITRQEFDHIFEKYRAILEEQYTPQPVTACQSEHPKYVPTPKTAGPKRINIEEYRKRQQHKLSPTPPPQKKKRKRGGKALQHRKAKAILYNQLTLATTKKEKTSLLKKIKALRHNLYLFK